MIATLIVLIAAVVLMLVMACFKVSAQTDSSAPAAMSTRHINNDDAVLLAKVMQMRSGANWPDWAVLLIGETVMNRVDSWRYPNTIEGVIFDTHPVYFTETYTTQWDELVPDAEYIDLAERLIAGERALNDPDMLFTGTSPEGTGVLVSYYDEEVGEITYFCRG